MFEQISIRGCGLKVFCLFISCVSDHGKIVVLLQLKHLNKNKSVSKLDFIVQHQLQLIPHYTTDSSCLAVTYSVTRSNMGDVFSGRPGLCVH